MSGTFCFELKKNAMIPLPVTTYINMVIIIQIRQCNTTSIFITIKDFGFAGNINKSPTCEAFLIPHLHDWRKMEVCLINFNKGEDDEVFKIVQYLVMECNCVRKITEGLFRKYSTL